MQCNTNYTGSPENIRHVNLNVLATFAERFPVPVKDADANGVSLGFAGSR